MSTSLVLFVRPLTFGITILSYGLDNGHIPKT